MESSRELFSVYDCPCGVTAALKYVSTFSLPQMHTIQFTHGEMTIDTTFNTHSRAGPVDVAALILWRVCLNMQSRGMYHCYEFWTQAYDVLLVLQDERDREREEESSSLESLSSAMTAPVEADALSILMPLRY